MRLRHLIKKEHDRISYLPGVTFKKWNENVSEEGNAIFLLTDPRKQEQYCQIKR